MGYSGNLSRFLHESSFGRLRWPASLGKVVNVNMNKATSVYGNCDGGAIVRDVVAVADAAGHSASGYERTHNCRVQWPLLPWWSTFVEYI